MDVSKTGTQEKESRPFWRRLRIAGWGVVWLSACAGSVAVSNPATDPANPAAAITPARPGYEFVQLPHPAEPHIEGKQEATESGTPATKASTTAIYTCPMHPELRAAKPGRCPDCNMTLQPMAPNKRGGQP